MAKNTKPAIRFKGFTDAWEQRKLGEVAENFEYGLNAAAKEFDGVNKYIRITDIDDESHQFNKEDLTSPDTNLEIAERYKLEKGDILFARTGASVGKSYIYRESDGLVYYAGFLIRGKIKEGFDTEFVFQNTLTEEYKNYIRITSQRSGQPGVNAQEYQEYSFKVPHYAEQKQIGMLFKNLDHLITLHQRKYDSLVNVKKAMLEKMFPKNGETVPEIRFKGFTDAWEQRKLGEVATEMIAGGDVDKELLLEEGHYPVIANALTNDGIVGYYNDQYRIKAPAVTVTGRGDVGHAKARNVDFTPVVRLLSIKTNHDVYFLENAINTLKIVIESTGVPQLTVPQLAKYEISFPKALKEEEKIGQYFANLDHLITLHQRKLEKLKNIKKSCLEKMFVYGGWRK
ncbi:restriction endonuclease subunit S [Phascolarctobacterium succinatutens]|uniref:restriction endonuclease subunit S n=1 Tax=Phascolarctobacterium succinatutens TaxID=626940 RepID=UPI003AAA493B